jgi:hypothetical protein
MKRLNPLRQRLAALGLMAIPLLTFPVIGLPTGHWNGIPASFLYLFGVWAGIVVLAAGAAERRVE